MNSTWTQTKESKKYIYKPIGGYGEVERLYQQKMKEKEEELENMRLKKEREERVRKEKERVENEIWQEQQKKKKLLQEQEELKAKAKKEKAAQEKLKLELHAKLFESFYGSEDEIFANKKKEVKYLFIYQIEDEDLVTEELSADEIEERLDKFGLSRNNYVIVASGKVVEFPLNNNLKT